MPPKQRITRDMILDQSFAMFEREGMEVVNARSVAKALNCSTQPIFSYFSSMDDLKRALDQRARESFERSVARGNEGAPSLERLCNAYVRFAGEQPKLFVYLFMRSGSASLPTELAGDVLLRAVREQERDAGDLSDEQARQLCASLWVHAHGLATARAAGLMNMSDECVARSIARTREGEMLRLKNCGAA